MSNVEDCHNSYNRFEVIGVSLVDDNRVFSLRATADVAYSSDLHNIHSHKIKGSV